MKILAILSVGCIAASCASAPSVATAQPAPPPPCEDDIYRQFDFWLGEWEVTAGGQIAGHNKISSRENGCLVLEEWTSAGGGSGQSYNFYDPGMKKWRQVWVSGFATIDYAGGLNADGQMVLEGEIAYRAGNTAPFKGVWTLNDDGTVTQHFTQYDAEKQQWADWFIGLYAKKTAGD